MWKKIPTIRAKKKRKEKRNQDGCGSVTLMDGNLCEKNETGWDPWKENLELGEKDKTA
jgi:hypothetical protein